jgi:23S rRNA (pseudouridine1915-N3)-methyltransferase
MKCHIIALGKKLDGPLDKIFQDYSKRLPKEFKLECILVEGQKPQKHSTQAQMQEKDSSILQALIPAKNFLVVLDERGTELTSEAFALKMGEWQIQHKEISFIIGGAFGLDKKFIKSCDFCWSLSKLTLPHQLVRVILAEQIYRAWTILSRHPYHK